MSNTVNKQRFIDFDIARVITLALMPLSHILDTGNNLERIAPTTFTSNSWILYISSLGAFVFMFLLGVNNYLSLKNTPSKLCKRALLIFIVAIVLNLIRYIIPGAISLILEDNQIYFAAGVYGSISSDILYFAALCFLFFALVKKLNLKAYIVVLIGITLSLIDGLITLPLMDRNTLSAFLGNFIYVDDYSSFAFAQWIVVPCMGYFFGEIYLSFVRKQEVKKLYNYMFLITSTLMLIIILIIKLFNIDYIGIIGCQYTDYNLNLGGVFILFAVYMLLQVIVYYCSIKIKNEKIEKFFCDFSKNITTYYFVQWILVIWSFLVLYIINGDVKYYINNIGYWLISICVVVLSYCISTKIGNRKKAVN